MSSRCSLVALWIALLSSLAAMTMAPGLTPALADEGSLLNVSEEEAGSEDGEDDDEDDDDDDEDEDDQSDS